MTINGSVSENAYAKINLMLDVVGKRGDGYHDVRSIMQSVSLCDRITLSLGGDADLLTRSGENYICGGEDITLRALSAFRAKTGMNFHASIHIEKHIPVAAGMAGGSADCAAVLRNLEKMTGNPLSEEELLALAESLGSDVPFCLCGGTKLVLGKGGRLEEMPKCPTIPLVAAIRGENVPTPWAYGLLDEKFGNFAAVRSGGEKGALEKALSAGDSAAVINSVYNIFEEVVPEKRPQVKLLKDELSELGAHRTLMSGSGPTVIGFFEDSGKAEEAARTLRARGTKAFYLTTI